MQCSWMPGVLLVAIIASFLSCFTELSSTSTATTEYICAECPLSVPSCHTSLVLRSIKMHTRPRTGLCTWQWMVVDLSYLARLTKFRRAMKK
ncbi:hypothetical protein BJX65DRAFT_284553 [Aspergillus insuetus]